jgi:quinolinate synthase
MADNKLLANRIAALKEQKQAVILAHYYTSPEVQQVADFVGDSLALAIEAAKTDARVILFAGVHFMAETAKVLCPDRKVLIPDTEAGCSLADSCRAEDLAEFLRSYPDHKVVSYVNTTVGVKALTDVCCTSSNALKVVQSIPADQPIVFGPDRNLGSYIQKLTGRTNMVLWNGACHVHEEFSLAGVQRLKVEHPEAKVVVHPECKAELVAEADYTGSTAGIIDYCGTVEAEEFIVVTEAGIMFELERRYPSKRFIPAPPASPATGQGCNECKYMKMVTLEKIAAALENEQPEIVLDEEVRKSAERSIRNMIAIK